MGVDWERVGKFLIDLGFSPLNIILIFAVIVLYRDNRDLWSRLQVAEDELIKALDKLHLPGVAEIRGKQKDGDK